MERAFQKYREARAEVVAAIERIENPERKEAVKELFEKNEQAWETLMESEALLYQGAKTTTAAPDIGYRRIVDANHTTDRVAQFRDFVSWIAVKEAANKGGAANGSQPFSSDTNRTTSAAGSRR